MTRTPTDAYEAKYLLSDVFCRCKGAVQSDVGKMAGELFRRMDIEGESLEVAAAAVGLSPPEARTVLSIVRCRMAEAMVDHISTNSVTDRRGVSRSE